MGQSIDMATQDLDLMLSPPGVSEPHPLLQPHPPTTSQQGPLNRNHSDPSHLRSQQQSLLIASVGDIAIVPVTREDLLREQARTREEERRAGLEQHRRNSSSEIDVEAILTHSRNFLHQREEQERVLQQEQQHRSDELRRITPRVPRDPASATDTGSDGEPTIATQLRKRFMEETHSLEVPFLHPLTKTLRAPSTKDYHRLPFSTSSDSSSSDPYPDPNDRRYKPSGEQQVPRSQRLSASRQEEASSLHHSAQLSEREENEEDEEATVPVENQPTNTSEGVGIMHF